jgi:putative acetyltransferase
MDLRATGLDDPRVIALLDHHTARARAETAPGSAHALNLAGLKAPEVHFWTAWEGDTPLGTGAWMSLPAEYGRHHGEIKSMHVAEVARRRGVGGVLLDHLIAEARSHGITRLSLETGSWPYFRPAHALYQGRGFVPCAPFATYKPDPNCLFLTLDPLPGAP